MAGFTQSPSYEGLEKLMNGPNFSEPPPTDLHCTLGWYPIEKIDVTLSGYLEEYAANITSMRTMANGLVHLFQRSI